jgi:cysteine desulfurase
VSGAYFDQNATTPLDPRVRAAMLPWMGERWGNPSSAHRVGQAAHAAVEEARVEVAALLGARPEEIVFTASGTEASNAVLLAAFGRAGAGGGRIVHSAFEHPSIRVAAAAWSGRFGTEVVTVPPERDGIVDVERYAAALDGDTTLAALMLANNEVGTLQPVAETAHRCRELGVPLLCDAVQAAGKVRIDVASLGADYVTIGAHKFHGPPGVAALWIRSGAPFEPLLVGGGQERQRRASTVAVPLVVGFGAACALARRELDGRAERLARLRERFEAGVAAIPGATIHAASSPRLPHTTSVGFPGLVNSDLMMRLDLAGFQVSTGSACASGVVEPSPALAAMGVPRDLATASIRVSFGMTNTLEEVEAFLPVLAREVAQLRSHAAPVEAAS